jgi:hypothetical protein
VAVPSLNLDIRTGSVVTRIPDYDISLMFKDHPELNESWNYWGSWHGGVEGTYWRIYHTTSNPPKWRFKYDSSKEAFELSMNSFGNTGHARGLYAVLKRSFDVGSAVNVTVQFIGLNLSGSPRSGVLVILVHDLSENKTYGIMHIGGSSVEPGSRDGTTYYNVPVGDVKIRIYDLPTAKLQGNFTINVIDDLLSKGYDVRGHDLKIELGWGGYIYNNVALYSFLEGFKVRAEYSNPSIPQTAIDIRLFVLLIGWAAAGLLVFKAYREMGVAV